MMIKPYSQSAFSRRVEEAVNEAGSFDKAAKACGLDGSTLFKIVKGREPSFHSYRRIHIWLTGKEPPLP